MTEVDNLSCHRVQTVETRFSRDPQCAIAILRDLPDRTAEVANRGERLSSRIEPIQKLETSDPERTRAVLEKRRDESARQAVRAPWIVHEYLEFITVESVQAVLGPKPDEPAIVLDDLRHTRLR